MGAPWGCPGGSPAAVLPAPAPAPAPAPCAPCSTCLYLAGRLQPQACSRPSSLRTCSRTWRYCSRFCSRRADDVQSLGRRHAGYFPRRPAGLPCTQHARALGPRWQDRGSPRTGSTGTCPSSSCRARRAAPYGAASPPPGLSSDTRHRIPCFCPRAKILVSKVRKTQNSNRKLFPERKPTLPVDLLSAPRISGGHRGAGHSLGWGLTWLPAAVPSPRAGELGPLRGCMQTSGMKGRDWGGEWGLCPQIPHAPSQVGGAQGVGTGRSASDAGQPPSPPRTSSPRAVRQRPLLSQSLEGRDPGTRAGQQEEQGRRWDTHSSGKNSRGRLPAEMGHIAWLRRWLKPAVVGDL